MYVKCPIKICVKMICCLLSMICDYIPLGINSQSTVLNAIFEKKKRWHFMQSISPPWHKGANFLDLKTLGSWWRHQREPYSTLLAFCKGNLLVTSGFPSQRPVVQSFDVFFDLHLNKWLSKQSRRWWFEVPSCSLWHHYNISGLWHHHAKIVPFLQIIIEVKVSNIEFV